jgi:hypothetical protein
MDRKVALRRELREARGWMTDEKIAEVVVRCASYGEIGPLDLRAVLAEYRTDHKWAPGGTVVACKARSLAEKRYLLERAERIVELWAENLTMNEIATRVEMTKGGLGSEMARLRKRGFDLPARPQDARFQPNRKAA